MKLLILTLAFLLVPDVFAEPPPGIQLISCWEEVLLDGTKVQRYSVVRTGFANGTFRAEAEYGALDPEQPQGATLLTVNLNPLQRFVETLIEIQAKEAETNRRMRKEWGLKW